MTRDREYKNGNLLVMCGIAGFIAMLLPFCSSPKVEQLSEEPGEVKELTISNLKPAFEVSQTEIDNYYREYNELNSQLNNGKITGLEFCDRWQKMNHDNGLYTYRVYNHLNLTSPDFDASTTVINNQCVTVRRVAAETQQARQQTVARQQPRTTVKTNQPPGYIEGTCKQLKAMGLSRFRPGDPNYTDARDGDNDGVACE